MDGSLRFRAVSLTLFLVFLTLVAIDPKFCYGISEVHCIQSEQQALLRFKTDLTDPLNRLASWAGDGDCCQWVGVVCNNVTGHVQELNLRSFPPPLVEYFSIEAQYEAAIQSYEQSMFGGKINPSLLDLKHLFYLDLSYNYFGLFPIPKFLGSMKSLRYLNLFGAGFGELIPPQIGNLSNLHHLNLGGFGYNFLSVNNLQWLSSLPLLQVLDLSGVDLSQASDLLQVTNKITSLSELWLSHCSLGFIPPTPNSNFSSLATLDLSFNSFENALIPSWVFGYQNLVALNLSANGFQGPIPIGLQNMTSLKHLDLSANNFNSSIPYWLYSFSHLEFLNLRKNLLQGKISSSIKNLTSAISIDLTSNQLDGKVPRSLGNVCNLRELRLSDNKLSQEVSEILESLLRCVSYGLEVLEMYDAQLSGHLIKELGQFQNLTTLSLEGNSIWGPIPISIGKLSSLRFLDLSNNQFNKTLPQSFGGLSKLEYVFIGGNMLEGVVSETHFANLRRLKELSTTPTRLTLKVSPNWIPPFQVVILGLGSWILGPNFPLWICSQKRVWSLDISNTNVIGAIPPLFWNMSSQFNYLNLSHNHIYGEIPNIPVTLYPSSVIDMSSNSFNGSLPCISSNVSFLDLSNNFLSGSISHFLCYKKNEPKQMELLNLGKNLLSGNISYCWENWQKLLVLNLGNNNFTGSIPASIEHLSLLKSLHLSNNKISGKLLHFLKNCTDLEIIDISENKFFGIIPSWIGQRHSSLIILILRSNNFHGAIPKQLCALTSLQILDLSHNKLFGSIPGCVNNLNAMASTSHNILQSTSHNILQDLFVVDGVSVDFERANLERANLVIKGQVREYTTNLGLLRTIDLAKNNLSGEIPKEVTSLQGLQSLNLSFNNLTGRIPENIGAMGSLESLDFSENQLSGKIPPHMSNLTFLSQLNLANNNLIGEIPLSTQLQSLNASGFIGNKLCGPPLTDNCTINNVKPNTKIEGSTDTGGREVDWFYVSMALGYVVGFCRYATEHRCGVVVKGPRLSGNISGTDPLKDNRLLLQVEALDDTDEARHTAVVVNELSKEMSKILISHPLNAKRVAEGKNVANVVLLRGCGIRLEVPPFEKKHGLWPCMVAPTKIIAGLGLSLAIDILDAPGATGDYRTLLTSKATAIAKALSAPLQSCPSAFVPGEDENKPGRSDGYDFGFLHIKAIDDAGHDKASILKVKGLEAVDRAIGQLARLLWEAESTGKFHYFLCVTGDHSTPVEYGDHSFETVPFAMCRLTDFVSAVGGESIILGTSLDPFPLPATEVDDDLTDDVGIEQERSKQLQAYNGDSVCEFNEISAARGCLGRFPGGEMMGIIKKFLKLDA